eukprot:GHVR01096954.1.p2 GENE.GHVR01096954.1~~GHVR01096954.1.p2  ORF type:complete len:115 (+),score=20.57 GHVR01096954.1:286-630(+)
MVRRGELSSTQKAAEDSLGGFAEIIAHFAGLLVEARYVARASFEPPPFHVTRPEFTSPDAGGGMISFTWLTLIPLAVDRREVVEVATQPIAPAKLLDLTVTAPEPVTRQRTSPC